MHTIVLCINKYSSNIPTNVMYDRMNMLLCKRHTQGSRRPFTMIPPSSPGGVVCIATRRNISKQIRSLIGRVVRAP